MKWEDLKFYKPLKKEDLKEAYKDFTKLVADHLRQDGFELKGRKLIKQSHDLFHIIHLDNRGSWTGTSDHFKTEISICSIYDTDTFILNYELTASKKIEELVQKIRNNYRINQEYPLLAEYLTRKIREYVMPYFSNFKSSKDILNNRTKFKVDKMSEIKERNQNLILYCELINNINIESSKILSERLIEFENKNSNLLAPNDEDLLLKLIQEKNWEKINEILLDKKEKIFKKLKIK